MILAASVAILVCHSASLAALALSPSNALPPITRSRQLQQVRENGCPKASNGIPAPSNRKSSRIATPVCPGRDVRKALVALAVEPRVQESERRSPLGDERVVDESDDGCH